MADDSFSLVAFDKAHYLSFPCHYRGETRITVFGERLCVCAYATVARQWLGIAVPGTSSFLLRSPQCEVPTSLSGDVPRAGASPSRWGAGLHCWLLSAVSLPRPTPIEQHPWRTVVTGPMATRVAAYRWGFLLEKYGLPFRGPYCVCRSPSWEVLHGLSGQWQITGPWNQRTQILHLLTQILHFS